MRFVGLAEDELRGFNASSLRIPSVEEFDGPWLHKTSVIAFEGASLAFCPPNSCPAASADNRKWDACRGGARCCDTGTCSVVSGLKQALGTLGIKEEQLSTLILVRERE